MARTESQAPGQLIVYDGACRFCRWALAWVLRWDRHRRLRPVALGSDEADRLLAGMDADQRADSWHLVDDRGLVRSAGAAAPVLLRLLPGGRPLAALLDWAPLLTERAYRWIADHRGAFGDRLGERAVTKADWLIALRS
jgi:predicted DCC family thiol-disulfide oxidoreductase YuxK